jgi:hypothetical protein
MPYKGCDPGRDTYQAPQVAPASVEIKVRHPPLRWVLHVRPVAEADESPVPRNTADVLFKGIYVPGSEPRWMSGRTAEETYYY